MPNVLIADAVSNACDDVLIERGIAVMRAVGVAREALLALLPDYDGLIVRSAVQVDRMMIASMGRMQVIGRAGAGVDNIDVDAARERGIIVMNTPGGNTISATEHTIAVLLALLRKIPAANASLRAGRWERSMFTGTELMGKRVGVLGLGRIGRAVAARLSAFESKVVGYDPILNPAAIAELGIAPVTYDELITASDIITIHIPLTPSTHGLIGVTELSRMKPGVIIVNTARGGIIDEHALADALDAGAVGGAAIDVFETEPPSFPDRLVEHPRVVATPHIAASTKEAQTRVAIDIAHQMADFFNGDTAGLDD